MISAGDYGVIDNFVQVPNASGFYHGDFNYDGAINSLDYDIINFNYGTAMPFAPDQPNELTAHAGRDTDAARKAYVELTWLAPQDVDVDGYNIYLSLNAGDTWTLHETIVGRENSSWRDYGAGGFGLADGTKYTYRIRAYSDTDGLAVTTNKVWTVTNLPGPAEQPKASLISQDAVTLTWNDNTSNETGFEIEQTSPGGVVTIIPVPGTNNESTMSFRVTGLTAATGYSFRVRAYTEAQDSAWSPAVAVTTLAVGVPIAPSHAGGTSGNWHSATITWQDNSADETGFTIQRLDANGLWQTIGTVGPDVTSFNVTSGLTSVTTYQFRVLGDGTGGSSGGDDGSGGGGGSGGTGGGGSTGGDSDATDNVASVTTPEAYGHIFSVYGNVGGEFGETLDQNLQSEWSGGEVGWPGMPGELLYGNEGQALTLTLTGLPVHGAIGMHIFDIPGDEWSVTIGGTEVVPSHVNPLVEHTGSTVSIEITPGSGASGEWRPSFVVYMESPKLGMSIPRIMIGEEVEATVTATDHALREDYNRPWPFDLTVEAQTEVGEPTAGAESGGLVTAMGSATIPAGSGVGTLMLKGAAIGLSKILLRDTVTQVAGAPQQARVQRYVISPSPASLGLVTGQTKTVTLTVTDEDGIVIPQDKSGPPTATAPIALGLNVRRTGNNNTTWDLDVTGLNNGNPAVLVGTIRQVNVVHPKNQGQVPGVNIGVYIGPSKLAIFPPATNVKQGNGFIINAAVTDGFNGAPINNATVGGVVSLGPGNPLNGNIAATTDAWGNATFWIIAPAVTQDTSGSIVFTIGDGTEPGSRVVHPITITKD